MDVKIFGSRLSPFVEKVVRAAQLKGIPHTVVPPKSPLDFKRWNPQTQKMPVLEVDGARTFDSTVILRRLDEIAPEPGLFDRDPAVAARQRFIEDWSDEALYWYVMGHRWVDENTDASVEQIVDDIGAPAIARPVVKLLIRRQIRGMAVAQGLVRLGLPFLTEELGRRFDELLVWLGDTPFMFSDRVGAADLALFGQLRTLGSGPTPQAAELITARRALVEYAERIDRATSAATTARPRLAAVGG